ncbi:MAG: hypothetical protein H6581_10315 [Bacteroidia bacterium]|nr:hypothetical protein [Bacteroidia bacterium]
MKNKKLRILLPGILMLMQGLILSAQSNKQPFRKALLDLANAETTNAAVILREVGKYKFEQYVDVTDPKNVCEDLNTVVHESCHELNDLVADRDPSWEYDAGYFIAEGVEIPVKKGPVYNSIALNAFVTDSLQKKIFRYKTYIGEKDGMYISSQSSGIYGMLDEFDAYYQGTLASYELYDYYYKNRCHGFEDEMAWAEYLKEVTSTHYAFYEFRIFISWYLQYARLKHPEVYETCMANTRLRLAFTLINDAYARLIDDYYARLDQLVKDLNQEGEKVEVKIGSFGSIMFTVYKANGRGSSGTGIHEDDVIFLRSLLEAPEHQVLEEFRLEGATMENFRDFL